MTCDTAFIRVEVPAETAFAFMAEPENMSLWSFGTWRTSIDESGLVRGTSIKDGSEIFVRIDPHPKQLLIDYHIGAAESALLPRIFVRVTPQDVFGDTNGAGLGITAFRTADMDEERWQRLRATHLVELDIVKAALETGFDHRNA